MGRFRKEGASPVKAHEGGGNEGETTDKDKGCVERSQWRFCEQGGQVVWQGGQMDSFAIIVVSYSVVFN
jgi:hypothetical protein